MSRRVVVAGLNVRFAEDSKTGRRVRPIERQMLDLATSFLADPVFLAVRETNGESFVEPSSRPMHALNRLASTGVQRLVEWPVQVLRIAHAVRHGDYVYARLPSPWGFAACRIARLLRRPHWVSLHGDAVEVLALRRSRARSALSRWYYERRARRAERQVRHATQTATLALSVGADLDVRYGRLAPRHMTFANFLHSAVADQRRPPSTDLPVLLFIGEVNHRKGIPDLLAAAQQLADSGRRFELRIVGEGELEDQAKRTNLRGDATISVAGWIDAGAPLDAEFARATLLVLPSTAGEGVPKVVLEAQTRRVPVVATAVGGIPELLDRGQRGWLVPPGDAQMLAETLATIMDGPDDVTDRVEAAANHMAANTFERTMLHIAEAVRQVDPGLIDESRLPLLDGTVA